MQAKTSTVGIALALQAAFADINLAKDRFQSSLVRRLNQARQEDKPMPFADSEGTRTYYDDRGKGEPALLCLPG